ncbi:Uncharacterized membrane-anchored protein [Granulicatella balaenopterae]|uniref:Uncharacterized membrane-anchored protein n=1 Tax=Granulicatella balaenopterae TaxID=137733 RepID=A0A1H9MAF6_9LACT|nr:DUF1129 family protein [Granulicatella balaenopterae]SER20622.1 Uncharacterized membrane-anchored protein [Granulicatella balaenopterae]
MSETKLTLEEIKANNRELKEKLTKKNEQYMIQLDRSLIAANYAEEQRERLYAEMLAELVEKQKTGSTARQLYGTVTERVAIILDGPTLPVGGKSPDWQIFVDGALFMGGLFSLMSGITMFLNSNQVASMGLVSLLINFLVGGLMLLILTKVIPDFSKPKGQRGYMKYLGVSTILMLAWIMVVMGSQAIVPQSINIMLPPVAYLMIGIVSLVGKWYFKKTFDVRGTIM